MEAGPYRIFSHSGQIDTSMTPDAWAREVEKRGAGEIFLNSIDTDGMAEGYDLDLIKEVVAATTIPVIACGGVGQYEHFVEGVKKAGASAVSAANIFHFKELSDRNAKRVLKLAGVNIRQ